MSVKHKPRQIAAQDDCKSRETPATGASLLCCIMVFFQGSAASAERLVKVDDSCHFGMPAVDASELRR